MRATTEEDLKKGFLRHEEVLDLARAWRDYRDEDARKKIIIAFRRLAVTAAAKARRGGIPVSDLIQEANIGLMNALERFDPELGFSFATLAQYHVRSCIQMYILANVGPVRIFNTGETKTLLGRYAAARNKYEIQGKLPPAARSKICEELGVKETDLDRFEQAIAVPVSLDMGAGESDDDTGGTRSHMLRSDEDSPEETVLRDKAQEEAREIITDILATLSDRERTIIRQRFFTDEDRITLETLSQQLGISRERVRQIELKALNKIGERLRERGIENVRDLLS